MRLFTRLFRAGAIVAAAVVLLFHPVGSQAKESYFKGKTITFLVGFGAGGGYDSYSRMLAPHFERVLGARVIVQNQPGAGGLRALNRVYRMEGDGLTMTIVNGTGAGLQQLLSLKAARFDLTKFGYLGIVDHARWIWLVSPKSPINTPADALNSSKVLSWGGSGKISGISDGAAMTCAAINLKCKIVIGYKGSRAAALAVAQGEMDALYVSETSADKYVKAQNAKAVATMNRHRSILFPNLPTIFEAMKLNEEQKWWIDYRATVETLGRILVVPPGTKPEILRELQAATRKILTDPKVIADANKKRRYIKYIPPGEAMKMVNTVLNGVTTAQKAKIRKVVLGE